MIEKPLTVENSSKTIWFSFMLGIVSILCALIIGEKALQSTVVKLEQQSQDFYLREAKMLARTATTGISLDDEESLLRKINHTWNDIEGKPADEYLCVVDDNARLLLHSAFPETVGNDAGQNPIFSKSPDVESCLRDLALSQKDYVGDYISSDGKKQLAAFAPILEKRWTIGLHRSKSALEHDIQSGMKYTRYALYIVCGLLLPLSLLLLFLIFKQAENRKRKIEDELRISENRYRLLAENSIETIWLMNLDGTFTYQSPSVKQLRGFTPKEAIALTLEQSLVPESMALIRRIFEQESQKSMHERWADRNLHLEMYRKDGSTIWTEVTVRAVRNELNEVVALQGNTRDITERKWTEEALRASEEKYRNIFENAVEGFFQSTLEGYFISVNPALVSMFGYASAEELVSRKFDIKRHFYVDQEDRTRWQQSLQSNGMVKNFEFKAKRKNGTHFWVSESTRAIFDHNGIILRYEGSLSDINEQKQAALALVESEQKWRDILVNLPQLGISLDANARISFANEHFLNVTGWRDQDVIGRDWFEMFIPETVRGVVRKVFKTVMDKKDIKGFSTYENEIMTKDGKLLNISWSNVITKDTQGNVVDITCLGVDLTERIRFDEALCESETRYRTLFERNLNPISIIDTKGCYLDANPAYVNFVEKTKDELLHLSVFDFSLPVEAKMQAIYPNELWKTGGTFEKKYIINEEIKILELTLTPISYQGIDAIVGIGRDITQRKEAESKRKKMEVELLNRNQFIETILDNLPIGLAVNYIDQGKTTYMNKEFERIYGWPKEELENINDLFEKVYPDKEYREKIKSKMLADVHSGDIAKMEWDGVEATGKNGQERIISAKNIPLYEQNLMISTVQDITESRNLQARLQQAQKMEAIGNLAGGIAHDFNNILFPIMGLSELLMDDLPPDSIEHGNVREIFKASERGRDLVNQILAFGRQSEKKLMPVLIQQVLRDLLKLSRSTIPSNIEIEKDIQGNCGRVLADPTQLHQIGMNLITNAYHAVEPTGGKISVQLKETKLGDNELAGRTLEPGPYALLTISDTGCGIEPFVLDKIFEPYFTTKEQGKGTGLGLAVVYGIVKEYKGDIQVSSEVGKGTTINVFIPIFQNFHDPGESKIIEPLEGGTERILLVDDEEAIVNLEKTILERLGYHATIRTSSIEALQAFRANPDAFDLLITDMTMPNMTGDTLAKEVKSIKPNIPVIICTGFSERMNQGRVQAIGIMGLLMKPIIKSDMAKMVRKVLDDTKR